MCFIDRLVRLIDSNSGTFQDFIGHTDYIKSLKFTKNGKYLISIATNEMLSWKLLL